MILEDSYVAGNPRYAGTSAMTVLSGCSGSGKSTLLGALSHHGLDVLPEAGRQVVREQIHLDGDALPWVDPLKFVELTASRAMWQFNTACPRERPVIFDRSIVDLVSFLELKDVPVPPYLMRALEAYRYGPRVFVTPPWPEIYASDAERSKGFDAALDEYQALVEAYGRLGYELVEVPRTSVAERAEFVIGRLSRSGG